MLVLVLLRVQPCTFAPVLRVIYNVGHDLTGGTSTFA